MCFEGFESNCGAASSPANRAPYTATFVQRLLDEAAIPVGMTNMDEFAMGSSAEKLGLQITRNPWDLARTPGGSSSGSAAAVTAGIVPIALGRTPAGPCAASSLVRHRRFQADVRTRVAVRVDRVRSVARPGLARSRAACAT
jgi:hypothetical protein